ncbi:MAG: aminopeptidase [Fusobacterium sp. JB019]|nr:aminopeptidase [Fusobacterium sp. JB019]
MDSKLIDLQSVCNKIISFNLGVKKEEEVLIVADTGTDMRISNALAASVQSIGAEFTIAIMPTRKANSKKALRTTNAIAKAAEAVDVLITISKGSAPAFDSRLVDLLFKEKSLRTCYINGREIDTYLKGGALADYEAIYKDGLKLKEEWDKRKTFELKSASGSFIKGELGEYPTLLGCGVAREKGTDMAFSDGEVSLTPNDNSVNGVLVIDGPIQTLGMPSKPIKLTIKNSRVISVDSGDSSIVAKLKNVFETVENSNYIAELAIGLNPCCLKEGDFIEEKKAYGNSHMALGDNTYFGGDIKSGIHWDVIIRNPTITMDEIEFVQEGIVTILK